MGQAGDAWGSASAALEDVADAIGGAPTGLERAEIAANQVAEALNPVNMVSAMIEGAAGAFDSVIPGSRGAATDILETVFG